MKYSSTILLFAAVVFWSSATARPQRNIEQGKIDAFTRGLIKGLEEHMPEPHKSILIKKANDVHDQHWDNYTVYVVDHILLEFLKYIIYEGVDTDEKLSSAKKLSPQVYYGLYARTLVSMAPSARREALWNKYLTVLEKDYKNEDDFVVAAIKIFEEDTELDFKKLDVGAEKFAELQGKVAAEVMRSTLISTCTENRCS